MTLVSTQLLATPIFSFEIDGDTFLNSFSIQNNSNAGESVTRFQLEIGSTDTCFDTLFAGSDDINPCSFSSNAAKQFSPADGTDFATGLVEPVLVPDASTLLDISFTRFTPGNRFNWDIDVDFNDGGVAVAGSDLIGATALIDFSDGQRLIGELIGVAGNPNASVFAVSGVVPVPTVSVPSGVGIFLLGIFALTCRKFRKTRI